MAAASAISLRKGNARLPPEVNWVLYVRNLPFNITSDEMYDVFGKYGAIRKIRIGTNKDTRETASIVYENIYDAKTVVDHLSGFNITNRYLIVLYYQHAKMSKKFDHKGKDQELTKLQEKYGVSGKEGFCGFCDVGLIERKKPEGSYGFFCRFDVDCGGFCVWINWDCNFFMSYPYMGF